MILTSPFGYSELGFSLQIGSKFESILLHQNSKSDVCFQLHHLYRLSNFLTWSEQCRAGVSATALAVDKQSSKVIHDGSLNINDWFFIHQARTNTLPVNGRPHNALDKRSCRRCGYEIESQYHVLGPCPANSYYIINRHNEILNILYNETIAINPHWKILRDQKCELLSSLSRVDLQIEIKERREFWLLDIKTPYDNTDNLEKTHTDNISKYKTLKNDLKLLLPGWKVILDTFVVGCLGSWRKENDLIMKKLKFSASSITAIKRRMISSNIQWSHLTWSSHNTLNLVDGAPSYFDLLASNKELEEKLNGIYPHRKSYDDEFVSLDMERLKSEIAKITVDKINPNAI